MTGFRRWMVIAGGTAVAVGSGCIEVQQSPRDQDGLVVGADAPVSRPIEGDVDNGGDGVGVDLTTGADLVEPPTEDVVSPACDPQNQCESSVGCVDVNTTPAEGDCVACKMSGTMATWRRVDPNEVDGWTWHQQIPEPLAIGTELNFQESLNDFRCDRDWRGRVVNLPFATVANPTDPTTPLQVSMTHTVTVSLYAWDPSALKHTLVLGCFTRNAQNEPIFEQADIYCKDHAGYSLWSDTDERPERIFNDNLGSESVGQTRCYETAGDTVLEQGPGGQQLRSRITATVKCPTADKLTIWHGVYGTLPYHNDNDGYCMGAPDPDDVGCRRYARSLRVDTLMTATPVTD